MSIGGARSLLLSVSLNLVVKTLFEQMGMQKKSICGMLSFTAVDVNPTMTTWACACTMKRISWLSFSLVCANLGFWYHESGLVFSGVYAPRLTYSVADYVLV